MLFNFRRESLNAWKAFLVFWKHATVFRLQISNCQVCVTVAYLNSNIVVEKLVVFFQNFMGSFKMRCKLHGASFSELSQCVNSCCFFVICCNLVGWKSIHFLFAVWIQTKLVFFFLFLWFPKFTGIKDFPNDIVKDSFKFSSNCVSDKVEEGKTGFSHFAIFFIHENLIHSFHNWHDVSVVEKFAVLVFWFTEGIGDFTQNIEVFSSDCIKLGWCWDFKDFVACLQN